MQPKIVRPDSKGRITLGRLAKGISGYTLTETRDHKIILEPRVEIPLHEQWLWNNPEALNQVQQGLKEVKAGLLGELGSFAQYIDDDIE